MNNQGTLILFSLIFLVIIFLTVPNTFAFVGMVGLILLAWLLFYIIHRVRS